MKTWRGGGVQDRAVLGSVARKARLSPCLYLSGYRCQVVVVVLLLLLSLFICSSSVTLSGCSCDIVLIRTYDDSRHYLGCGEAFMRTSLL